jgi:hypothetical protein
MPSLPATARAVARRGVERGDLLFAGLFLRPVRCQVDQRFLHFLKGVDHRLAVGGSTAL